MTVTHVIKAELSGPANGLIDITADVDISAGLTWVWGRSDWLSTEPSAGTLTFTLDNRTGNYTPGSPNGTYSVGCAEGVGVSWWVGDPAGTPGGVAATGRTLFFRMGVPTISFPNSSGGSGFVEINCTDVIGSLQNRLMRTTYEELTFDLPGAPLLAGYWPLTETTGTTAGLDVSGSNAPALVQASTALPANVQWAQGGGVPAEGVGALYLTGGAPIPSGGTVAPFTTGYWGLNYVSTRTEVVCPVVDGLAGSNAVWTFAVWVTAPRPSAMSGGGFHAMFEVQMSDGFAVGIIMDRTNGQLLLTNSLNPSGFFTTPWQVNDGASHLVSLSVVSNLSTGALTAYVGFDYFYPAIFSITGASTNRPVSLTLGAARLTSYSNNCMDWTGAMHHAVLWTGVTTNSTGGSPVSCGPLYTYGITTSSTQTSADRAQELLSYMNPPVSMQQINTPLPDLLEKQDTAGQYMLPMLGNALRGEDAQFASKPLYAPATSYGYMPAPAVIVVFQPAWSNLDVDLTIDADLHTVGVPQIAGNLSGRVSTATAAGRYASASYTDPTLTAVTTASASLGAATSDPSVLASIAQKRVASTRASLPQVTQVTIDLNTSVPPTSGEPWLSQTVPRLPGDRIQVTNLPAAALGSTYTNHYLAGGSETYSLTQAEVMYLLQPADSPGIALLQPAAGPTYDSLWRFDGDTGCTVNATYTATATTLRFTHGATAAWSTVAADYPLTVNVGGECVRLNSVPSTVSSTVQQFTGCTRGYLGTKSRQLNSGAAVGVWLSPSFAY